MLGNVGVFFCTLRLSSGPLKWTGRWGNFVFFVFALFCEKGGQKGGLGPRWEAPALKFPHVPVDWTPPPLGPPFLTPKGAIVRKNGGLFLPLGGAGGALGEVLGATLRSTLELNWVSHQNDPKMTLGLPAGRIFPGILPGGLGTLQRALQREEEKKQKQKKEKREEEKKGRREEEKNETKRLELKGTEQNIMASSRVGQNTTPRGSRFAGVSCRAGRPAPHSPLAAAPHARAALGAF